MKKRLSADTLVKFNLTESNRYADSMCVSNKKLYSIILDFDEEDEGGEIFEIDVHAIGVILRKLDRGIGIKAEVYEALFGKTVGYVYGEEIVEL